MQYLEYNSFSINLRPLLFSALLPASTPFPPKAEHLLLSRMLVLRSHSFGQANGLRLCSSERG